MNQSDIDNLMLNSAGNSLENLPKGIQRKTLDNILSYFESNSGWCSTDIIADALGISIVTVRNYMNYLVRTKEITENINYSTGGRPSMLYKRTKN